MHFLWYFVFVCLGGFFVCFLRSTSNVAKEKSISVLWIFFILKNILAHEELRNAQSSLQKSQETVKKLEKIISEKETQILSVEEMLGKTTDELKIQVRCFVIIQN